MVIDLLGGLLAALLLISATFLAAYRVAWAILGATPTVLRFASVLLIGTWLTTVGFHALFSLGAFEIRFALPAALLLAFASTRWIGKHSTARLLERDRRVLRLLTRRRFLSLANAPLLLFAPFIALHLVRSLLQPPMGWDSLVYHLPRAARFVQEGTFTFDPAPGSWSFYRNVFAGGEVLWAWAMLPFGNDSLVGLAGFVPWLGVGLATWAFARALRLREPLAGLSGLMVLFIPTLQLEVPSGYVEPPACMAVMVALAAAVHGMRRTSRPTAGALLLTAAGAGIAFGIKPPLAIAAVLACVPVLVSTCSKYPLRALLPVLVGAAIAALLPALPWVLHSWSDTGAPLSPMPLSLFGLTLGKADPHLSYHLSTDISGAYTWARERRVLEAIFAPPFQRTEALGLFSLIPLALAPLGLWRTIRRTPATGILLALALCATCAFPYLPGFSPPRLHQSANISRFVIVPVLIAIPLSLLAFQRFPQGQRGLGAVLGCAALFYAVAFAPHGTPPAEMRRILVALGMLSAAVLLTWLPVRALRDTRPLSARAVRTLSLTLVLAVTAGLFIELRKEQLSRRAECARGSFQIHPTPTYWAAAASAIDDPQQARRLAVTAGSSTRAAYWFSYFFMGSELQNQLRYVPVTADGHIAHFGKRSGRTRLADRRAWIGRLETGGITHVVSFRPASIELAWMRAASARFHEIDGTEDWGLFEFTARPE